MKKRTRRLIFTLRLPGEQSSYSFVQNIGKTHWCSVTFCCHSEGKWATTAELGFKPLCWLPKRNRFCCLSHFRITTQNKKQTQGTCRCGWRLISSAFSKWNQLDLSFKVLTIVLLVGKYCVCVNSVTAVDNLAPLYTKCNVKLGPRQTTDCQKQNDRPSSLAQRCRQLGSAC